MISEKMRRNLAQKGGIRDSFNEAMRQKALYGEDKVFDLSLGNPGAGTPNKVDDIAVRYMADHNFRHNYMNQAGYEDARAKIADSLNRRFRTEYTAENITMNNGASGALVCLIFSLLDPGDEGLVFKPYYPGYAGFIQTFGGEVVTVEPKGQQMYPDFDDLSKKLTPKTKFAIINSPQNPSGTVYTKEVAGQLADVLSRKEEEFGHPIYLISDEPYRELVFEAIDLPWFPDYYKNTIVVYSYSKSLSLAGERIGYTLIPDQAEDAGLLRMAIRRALGILGFTNANALFQKVAAECTDESVDLEYYRRNRELLYHSLIQFGFQAVEPQGAFFIFLRSPYEDEMKFMELCNRYHIILVPGRCFGMSGYVRVSFCGTYESIKNSIPAFRQVARECGLLPDDR